MNLENTRIIEHDGTAGRVSTRAFGGKPPPETLAPGTVLINTYQVERWIGEGGMSEVYLARHLLMPTMHAIKVIHRWRARDEQVMQLFYREAEVLREIRHDAVVCYDGCVRDSEGREYLVMEYVEGPPLSDRLRRGACRPEEVWALRDRLCAGLAEVHRKGVVHRDLSPDNVILPGDRIAAAKLIDFGLSKLTDPGKKTIVGSSFAGKFGYASPEQFGFYGGTVDARSDIYSLGLTLAATAVGRPLDMGDSPEAALESRRRLPDLSGIPPQLREWMTAMLQPDPADRPASVQEILDRWPAPTGTSDLKKRVPLLALGLLSLLAAGGVGLYWLLQPQVPTPVEGVKPTGSDTPGLPSGQPTRTPDRQYEPPRDALATSGADEDEQSRAEAVLLARIGNILMSFDCAALRANLSPEGTLVVAGQVRGGEKTALYDRLHAAHAGRVDVTAVETQPWPLCAVTSGVRGRVDPAAERSAPRIVPARDPPSYRLGDRIDIRIRSKSDRDGRISLVYVDSAGEALHILPYANEPDAIAANGDLQIAPLVAEKPVGQSLLIATWCNDKLYREPPPEKQALAKFLGTFTAALDAAGTDCAISYLPVEVRAR